MARPRRQARGQAAILTAAARAVAEHGAHGMSMRALARETGFSLANLYNYFPSKGDLLFALQLRAFETLTASAAAAAGRRVEAEARLYAFILNHVRYVASHPDIMRVLVQEAGALPPAGRHAVRALKERYFALGRDLVVAVLAEARPRGVPDAAEIERLTYSLFGMLNWVYGWYRPKRHGGPQAVARTIHDVALRGLAAREPSRRLRAAAERRLAATALVPPLVSPAQGEVA